MIAISVVSHGQKELVRQMIEDLARISSPLVTHIVITHNLTDDRQYFSHSIGGARVTQIYNSSSKGFGANHNSAFALIEEHFFAVLNPDLRIQSDPFGTLIQCFNDSFESLVAPCILNPDQTIADSIRGLYTPFESLKGFFKMQRPSNEPAWIAGMFLLFRSSAYRSVGGFDEKFFMYVEDVDICARLVLAGHSIRVEPAVAVVHDAQRASHSSIRHLKWHMVSALKWWTSQVFWDYRTFLRKQRQS
jgi:N-acetylglucosaminyl-diphospho-decaprenol L-rhamnosyltransferase